MEIQSALAELGEYRLHLFSDVKGMEEQSYPDGL